MTISSLSPVNQYLGDGVQTAFPVCFPFFGDGRHVKAVLATGVGNALEERLLVYGLDYSVSKLAGGGECRTAAPVPDGHRLTLSLELPYEQVRDFDNQGRLDAEEIEKGLDYVTALAAQNAAALSRTVMVPVSDPRSPGDVLAEIFTARDEAQEARGEAQSAAETAQGAAQSAQSAAETARTAAEEAHAAAALHADRAEEARDTARGYAEQAAMQSIPAATDVIRGGIRVGAGLTLVEGDELRVAVPLPPCSAEDQGKVLTVGEGGALVWQKAEAPEGGGGGAFPMPKTEAGIGQVLQVSGRTVPPGGTWLVWAFCSTAISSVNGVFFPGGYSGSAALIGVYPGGATVPLSSTSATMAGMLCWRIA